MSTLKKLEILREYEPNVYVKPKCQDGLELSIHAFPHLITTLDFHEVEKLYWWLDSWMDEQRKNCLNCGHERAGCQYHDG